MPASNGSSRRQAAVHVPEADSPPELPVWDGVRGELRFHGRIIKRLRALAHNQRLILAVFQEEGWPPRIDDPLLPTEQDPQQRMRKTVQALNQQLRGIRFLSDGTGSGILWEPCSNDWDEES